MDYHYKRQSTADWRSGRTHKHGGLTERLPPGFLTKFLSQVHSSYSSLKHVSPSFDLEFTKGQETRYHTEPNIEFLYNVNTVNSA